ncbi:MAG: hypothetical protein COT84_04095 [Chlamydiae bacterium CG10_big_fil_rev_8_21_14_0_10_35_9]|nr:MAG: hypothetical protein COT84_04095 [Chlamydiae bacterium CG10_big_fil_rev_8_21_14_0_10_35_9]
MIINPKVLSIPPYLSTSWKNIISLHLEEKSHTYILIVQLKSGTKIEIPNLEKSVIEKIFNSHAKYLEIDTETPKATSNPLSFGMPLKFGIDSIDSLGTAMQHNPAQADTPPLPSEILSKITKIVKVLGIEDSQHLPKPEPHCNCLHCQIARALQVAPDGIEENLDEEVKDEELTFKEWEIEQTGENMYSVTNPLDTQEQYNVFLGEPIGCTCGKKDCEHIKAVLRS